MRPQDYADLYALEEEFWWFAGMREITAALLDSVNSHKQDILVLDAGCGTGGNLKWLTRYTSNNKIIGIDSSREALKFCFTDEHRSLAQASVTSLPFADEVLDMVTSFDVLQQLPDHHEEKMALAEMNRVLKPGGIIFVRVAAYQWLYSSHDAALQTQRRYALGSLRTRIEGAGFQVVRATYANSFLMPVAIARRLILKRVGLADRGSDVKPLKFAWINKTFEKLLRVEAWWLRWRRFTLPFGLSAICVAVKSKNL